MFEIRNMLFDDDDDHDIFCIEEKEEEYEDEEKKGEDEEKTAIVKKPLKQESSNAIYDSHIIQDILNKSTRFNDLKTEMVSEVVEDPAKFSYMKKYALQRLEATFMGKLAIFDDLIDRNEKNYLSNDELSHGIFSWYWEDFQKRREITNFVWVDVLLRTAEDSLHMYKFQQDLKQLTEYIKKIFEFVYLNLEDKEFDIYTHIEKPIMDMRKVLQTGESVEEELQRNRAKLKQLLHKEHFVESARRDTEEKFLKQFLECRIWNSHIWDPITIRYNLDWCRNLTDQHYFRLNNVIEKKTFQINTNNLKTQTETFLNQNCMDFFYTTTDLYKRRLHEMEDKYEKLQLALDNKSGYTRIQIQKIKEQRKLLEADIERFHAEIDKVQAQKAKREEERRLKMELEMEQEALQSKKDKAPGPKAASKGKGKAAGPKAAKGGKAADPKAVKGKAADPKAAKGKAADPKAAKGKAADPKAAKGKAAGTKEIKGKTAVPKGAGKKKGK